jgi:uncharacterized protein (TIGR03437 family)
MKPATVLSVCLFVLTPGAILAQVRAAAVTLARGSSAVVPLSVNFSAPVTALQFDIECDRYHLQMRLMAGGVPRAAAKDVYAVPIQEGWQRIVIVGWTGSPLEGGDLASIHVSANEDASPGSYPIRVMNVVASSESGDPVPLKSIDGAVVIDNNTPNLALVSVLNAASLLPGPVTAGEIITVLTSGFPSKANLSLPLTLSFDGLDAPLLWIEETRFNALVPKFVTGRPETVVQLRRDDGIAASTVLPIAAAAPGLFTITFTGTGQVVALHENGFFNSSSHPALANSILTLYATGCGNGKIAVFSGTDPWEVTSAIPADGLPGVTAISVRVPAGIERSAAVNIHLEVAGVRSQAGTTVAVH